MASKSLGTLTVDLIAKVGGFVRGMTEAERAADKSAKKILAEKKRMAKKLDDIYKNVGKFAKVGFAAVAAAATAAAAAVALAMRDTIQQGAELQRMAMLANSTVQEFQALSIGARTVGLETEKMGDMLKDFNEKVGEFHQTGAGQMKDFFEQIAPKIGITADAFKGLSGPQALQLYYDSLERAGLSQEEMSFYMENMASDATALIPLLADGGARLNEIADAADNAGAIMSNGLLVAMENNKVATQEFDLLMQGLKNQITEAVLPAVTVLISEFTAWWKESEMTTAIMLLLEDAIEWVSDAVNVMIAVFHRSMTHLQQVAAFVKALGLAFLSLISQISNATKTVFSFYNNLVSLNWRGAYSAIVDGQKAAMAELRDFGSDVIKVGADAADAVEGHVRAATAAMGRVGTGSFFGRIRSMNEAVGNARAAAAPARRTATGGGVRPTSGGGGGRAGKAAKDALTEEQKEAQKLKEQYDRLMESMAKRQALIGQTSETAELAYDLEHGELKNLDAALKEQLLTRSRALELAEKEEKERQRAEEEKTRRHERDQERAKEYTENLLFEISLLGKTADEQERLNLLRDLGTAAMTEQGQAAVAALGQLQEATKAMEAQIEIADTVRSSFSGAFQDWVSGSKSFKDAMLGALDAINAKILQMIADNLMEKLFGGQGSGFGGMFGGLFGGGGKSGSAWVSKSGGSGMGGGGGWFSSFFGSLFGGGMASGGRALPGMMYEVNEKGPELLTVRGRDFLMTGRSGATITPNHKLSGGGGVAQTNNFLLHGRIDRRTQQQIAMDVGRKSSTATRRNS